MITNNIIQRTLLIEFNGRTASAFTIEKNDKQLLVTARHLFVADKTAEPFPKLIRSNDTISIRIFHNNVWKELSSTIHFHTNIDIDIAVFELPIQLTPKHPLPLNSQGLIIGQDTYFLGFPFQLKGESGKINNSFPFPFVKKAVFSAIQKGSNNEFIYYFDGHNNPGFSGGPIVFKKEGSDELQVCGVVRGYVPQKGTLDTPYGKASYTENSGIIVSYNVKHLKEIVDNIIL